jgi:hypothetical protein
VDDGTRADDERRRVGDGDARGLEAAFGRGGDAPGGTGGDGARAGPGGGAPASGGGPGHSAVARRVVGAQRRGGGVAARRLGRGCARLAARAGGGRLGRRRFEWREEEEMSPRAAGSKTLNSRRLVTWPTGIK